MNLVRLLMLLAMTGHGACSEFQFIAEEAPSPDEATEPENASEAPQEPKAPTYEQALDMASKRLEGTQTKTSKAMRELQNQAGGGPAILDGGEWSDKADAVMDAAKNLEGKETEELLKALNELRDELEKTEWTGDKEADLNRARRVAEAEQILARIFVQLADTMGATEPEPPETKQNARRRALNRFVHTPLPHEHVQALEPKDPAYKGQKAL